VCAGDNLPQALAAANKVDDLLEEYLDFAFDKNFGYLTACPTNVGTGLRASYMMHLPCLERTNLLKKLFPYIIESGMTLRGIYGEGTISMGSIYQLSNQITLGKNEAQIIKNLSAVAKNVMRRENQALGAIEAKKPGYLQDRAYRAYGVLTNARTLSVKETMAYLSDIRLGFFANLLDLPKPSIPIYQIMMEIQPGHLHLAAGDILDERETDIARACYCRSVLRQDR
jgi:protein arginine kinase